MKSKINNYRTQVLQLLINGGLCESLNIFACVQALPVTDFPNVGSCSVTPNF